MALVAMNSANADQEKQTGPSAMAVAVMLASHSDLSGAHCTCPSSGLVSGATKIRSEPGRKSMD
jgi:hypothetical protein